MSVNACVGGEQHNFKPMLVETAPPSIDELQAVGVNDGGDPGDEMSFDADDRVKLILAMSRRRYNVVCEACGAIACAFSGKVEGEDGTAG